MADFEDRKVGDIVVRIDRTLCVGFGDCVTGAPEAFRLDAEGIVEFLAPGGVARQCLIDACDTCPVDALTVWDEAGRQIVPS